MGEYLDRATALSSSSTPACSVCEGIVSKRLGSSYYAGRSKHWIKIKNPAARAGLRLEARIGMVDLVAKDENVKTVLFLCTGNND